MLKEKKENRSLFMFIWFINVICSCSFRLRICIIFKLKSYCQCCFTWGFQAEFRTWIVPGNQGSQKIFRYFDACKAWFSEKEKTKVVFLFLKEFILSLIYNFLVAFNLHYCTDWRFVCQITLLLITHPFSFYQPSSHHATKWTISKMRNGRRRTLLQSIWCKTFLYNSFDPD